MTGLLAVLEHAEKQAQELKSAGVPDDAAARIIDNSLIAACLRERGIKLANIDAAMNKARGVIVDWQIDLVAEKRARVLSLVRGGKLEAAIEAGQALFEAANGLHNATVNAKPLRAGKKVIDGGRRGAAKTNGKRVVDAKRPEIEAAIKAFKGESRSMASIIAKRYGVTARYVREIKAELAIP